MNPLLNEKGLILSGNGIHRFGYLVYIRQRAKGFIFGGSCDVIVYQRDGQIVIRSTNREDDVDDILGSHIKNIYGTMAPEYDFCYKEGIPCVSLHEDYFFTFEIKDGEIVTKINKF